VNWKYYHWKQVHLLTSSNMYQYHKNLKINVSQLLTLPAYRYSLKSTSSWFAFFERSNAFLFGPITLIFEHCLSTSLKIKSGPTLMTTTRPASRKKVTYLKKTFTTRLALHLRARVLTLLHKTGFTYCPPSPSTILTLSPPAPLTILPKNPEKNTLTTDVWSFFAGPLDLWTRPLSTFQLFSKVPSTSYPTPLTEGPTLTLLF